MMSRDRFKPSLPRCPSLADGCILIIKKTQTGIAIRGADPRNRMMILHEPEKTSFTMIVMFTFVLRWKRSVTFGIGINQAPSRFRTNLEPDIEFPVIMKGRKKQHPCFNLISSHITVQRTKGPAYGGTCIPPCADHRRHIKAMIDQEVVVVSTLLCLSPIFVIVRYRIRHLPSIASRVAFTIQTSYKARWLSHAR